MSKVILLLLIIGVKILLTKGLMLGFLLLCMAIKGKALHKNSSEWDKYFLQFAISLYLLSAIISVFICYLLLCWLNFLYPFFLALMIFLAGFVYSLCKYRKSTKDEIAAGLLKVKNSIKEKDY